MTIDLWGLGLQAVNVLVLIWLLSRLFWRPVAAAIVARQVASLALLDKAEAVQTAADAALAEAEQDRKNNDAARSALLDTARQEAEAQAKALFAEAAARAETLHASAAKAIAKERAAASKDNAAQAAALSLLIATKLLDRLAGPEVQSHFLDQLLAAIAQLPEAERNAISATPDGVEIVVPSDPGADAAQIKAVLKKALGGKPALRFVRDETLIAGIELRTAHFALRNSWQADLAQIENAVLDAV
jgi:F-type H+-transporting ATPase subunit b